MGNSCCSQSADASRGKMLQMNPHLAVANSECNDSVTLSVVGVAMFGVIVCRRTASSPGLAYWNSTLERWDDIEEDEIKRRIEGSQFDIAGADGTNASGCWDPAVAGMLLQTEKIERGTKGWHNFKHNMTDNDIVVMLPVLMNDHAIMSTAGHVSGGAAPQLKMVTQYFYGSDDTPHAHKITMLISVSKQDPTRRGVRLHTVSQMWDSDAVAVLSHTNKVSGVPERVSAFAMPRMVDSTLDGGGGVLLCDLDSKAAEDVLALSSAHDVLAVVQANNPEHYAESRIIGMLAPGGVNDDTGALLVCTLDAALNPGAQRSIMDTTTSQRQSGIISDVELMESLMKDHGSMAKYASSVEIYQFSVRGSPAV